MTMLNLARHMCLILALGVLAGCAATVNRSEPTSQGALREGQSNINISQIASKTILLKVDAPSKLKADENWLAFLEEWETSMTAITSESQTSFKMLKGDEILPSDPAALVKIWVNDFKYVSQVKRYMIGILAGNASMNIDVEYFEMPGLKPLGQINFNTTSSAGQGVFSAMTPKQVNAVSIEIVGAIKATP